MIQSVQANWAPSKFGAYLTQSAISVILKKRKDLETMTNTKLSAKRPRIAQNSKLEEFLSTWVVQCQTKNVVLTGEVIKAKNKVLSKRLGLPEGTIKFSCG